MQTCMATGPSASQSGAGMWSMIASSSGIMSVVVVVRLEAGVAVDRARVDDRGSRAARRSRPARDHEIEDLVDDLVRARAGPVDLVHDEHRLEAVLERLLEHEAGLRHRPFERIDDEQAAVGHLEHALDLAAEVGVAGRVDDVDLRVAPADRDVLRQDRDATLALLVVAVEHALLDLLVLAEDVGVLTAAGRPASSCRGRRAR